MNINEELVRKLRILRVDGANTVELLEEIKKIHREDRSIIPLSMKYFRESFGLPMSDVVALAGWCGFGGELSNERICELLEPCFKK